MRSFILFLPAFLTAMTSLSQTVQKTTVKSPVAVKNAAVQQSSAVKTSATSTAVINHNSNVKVDSAKASLVSASFEIGIAASNVQGPGTNKALDTHWSCTLFDQNNREVARFQDNSNSDEYVSGSETPLLNMQLESAVTFGDLLKAGRFHISITPGGNDTWEISEFDLNLAFSSPGFNSKLIWNSIRLTQNNKDIDLFFSQQNNGVLKYDLKANKDM